METKKRLAALVMRQVQESLGLSAGEFEYSRHPGPSHLHDPFGYKGMRELAMHLHRLKKEQEKDETLLLVIRSDYDTDGVCASAVLTGGLSVFGFHFRVFVPTMETGYGLNRADIDKIKADNEADGHKVAMILTADNGISSYAGISYAASKGIDVLVTDHHPGDGNIPHAKAVVDANQPDDLYPFKGNSGACVAWKAMLAYASMFEKEKLPLVGRLIVFAGISNVADVMPMRNENRYTVVAAINILKELMKKPTYQEMADTPYPEYNTLFHGLFDLISLLQQSKDEKRQKARKNPIPLAINEELIAYYISPLLNSPRRVHETCLEAMGAFLVSDMGVRQQIIKRLIELNEEKSKLRDEVLNALPPGTSQPVICANTRKGISGLVAGKLSEQSKLPSIVFSRLDETYGDAIYADVPANGRLTASARSNRMFPLDLLISKMNAEWAKSHPGQGALISGGGHATAAGITIDAENYGAFCQIFAKVLVDVYAETLSTAEAMELPENEITLVLSQDGIMARYQVMENGELHIEETPVETSGLASDAEKTVEFLESMRPFGEEFEAETTFRIVFGNSVYSHGWNPDFWKTFKFDLYGMEVLTFDIAWAKEVKQALERGETVSGSGKLKLNEFRGNITPQLLIAGAGKQQ